MIRIIKAIFKFIFWFVRIARWIWRRLRPRG